MSHREVFLPLSHRPRESQIDFGTAIGFRDRLADDGVTVLGDTTNFYIGNASGGFRENFDFAGHGDYVILADGDTNAFAHGRGKTQFSNMGFVFNPIVSATVPYCGVVFDTAVSWRSPFSRLLASPGRSFVTSRGLPRTVHPSSSRSARSLSRPAALFAVRMSSSPSTGATTSPNTAVIRLGQTASNSRPVTLVMMSIRLGGSPI